MTLSGQGLWAESGTVKMAASGTAHFELPFDSKWVKPVGDARWLCLKNECLSRLSRVALTPL